MELIKIISVRQVFESVADKEDIQAHLSYWMAKFLMKTEGEYNFYVTEMRKLLDKFATKTEGDEGTSLVPFDKVAEFNNALEKLNNTDVEDPGIRFNLSEITKELKLSMRQMYSLLDFINEDQ